MVMRDEHEIETTGSRRFTRWYVTAFAVAALIGLLLGVLWVIAGLLNFHVLR